MHFVQDIYWNNLPSKILRARKKGHTFNSLIKNSFISSIKEPFFLFTGTNDIDFSFLDKDKKILKKLSKRKVKFFLYEPVSYYFEGSNFNLSYYSEFHSDHNNHHAFLSNIDLPQS